MSKEKETKDLNKEFTIMDNLLEFAVRNGGLSRADIRNCEIALANIGKFLKDNNGLDIEKMEKERKAAEEKANNKEVQAS